MQERELYISISKTQGITPRQVENTICLLKDGCTIPFISRYRKEATGNLDEIKIQSINESYLSWQELEKRREYIEKVISDSGNMTDELKLRIDSCVGLTELEDIYLPYKPKRRTRAEMAREKGLEPLAKIIMAQSRGDIVAYAKRFLSDKVADVATAIAGARDIIAEWISENQSVRNTLRGIFQREALISSKVIKGKEIEGEKYRNYFDLQEPLKRCGSYRILAMRRGENEGYLRVSINVDEDKAIRRVGNIVIKNDGAASDIVREALTDGYKRLLRPSIESEYSSISKELADKEAIDMFAQNVRQLLFAPPLGKKRVLGIDPGYRTGCKVVCLDEQGKLLHNDVIYPTPPKNEYTNSAKKISNLVESYKIDAIAVGNGTASRETEQFLKSLQYKREIKIFVVSENGASIYSASNVAREEFPDKDVTVRGAVSIARRLLDPLSELVKIDPKSIGVGQYQHDVDQSKLKEALNFTVESCVNSVGVNVNTASRELLSYVSGIGPQLAQNIVGYRSENGEFTSREELKQVPRMGEKAFQQSAGFLRIPQGENILDNSAVHPESYGVVMEMAKGCGCTVAELVKNKEKRDSINIKEYITENIGELTLRDIMKELEKPGRDPRAGIEIMEFDESVKTIADLRVGMELNGIVTNITQFGAFVDIGIHENGLVHISEMSDEYVTMPSKIVSLHQHVKVRVIDIDMGRKRVSLSMKGMKK